MKLELRQRGQGERDALQTNDVAVLDVFFGSGGDSCWSEEIETSDLQVVREAWFHGALDNAPGRRLPKPKLCSIISDDSRS